MSERFLAIDLGAQSGRAMLGELESGRLALTEVRRFLNDPVREATGLHWDAPKLWSEIQRALEDTSGRSLDGIGLDTWGCDFALLGGDNRLLENPYHYRDTRTDGVLDVVADRVGRERLYALTGCQLLPFNTLFQMYAACRMTPKLLEDAKAFLLMPDLFNFWLTGEMRSEYTIASTTQMIDPRSRAWATSLLDELGLPARLLQPIIEPGTILGSLRAEACAALAGTPVVAPAGHDTGSAFAAVGAGDRQAVISSGTWSLLGAEVDAPVMTERARQLNFTNEGGVCGTTRVLKNITGMWLLQSCTRAWASAGQTFSYDDLLSAAQYSGQRFRSLIDPDHHDFFHPPDMPEAIVQFCRRTGQPAPEGPGGYVRAIVESLAFKYRVVLESLEELIGGRCQRIRIVGGGANNRLLCQLTADVTGRPVVAGPIEATALGNMAMQMLATGAVKTLDDARAVIERSFPGERYEPIDTESWDKEYPRFVSYLTA
jgi:rhamnulokinase